MPSIDFEDREKEEQIYEILCASRRPVKAKLLAEQVATSERMVRRFIRNLISRGKLIASSMESPYGYFIPRTEKEKERYSNQLKSRIKHIAQRLSDFDRNVAERVQQALMFHE